MDKSSLITIGKVSGVHGLNGGLKIRSWSDAMESLYTGQSIHFENGGTTTDWHEVIRAVPYKKGILLTLKGVDNRDEASSLIGADIQVRRQDLPEPEPDTYYWEDLYGLEVMDQTRGYLGRIESIFPTGANDVLVVKDKKMETLVPVISSVVLGVDLQSNRMDIDLPEGL